MPYRFGFSPVKLFPCQTCPSLNVDFNTEENTIDCGEQLVVNFNDNSTNAVNWEWDVDGDDVVDYTTQNPQHVYSPGVYDVALTISNTGLNENWKMGTFRLDVHAGGRR